MSSPAINYKAELEDLEAQYEYLVELKARQQDRGDRGWARTLHKAIELLPTIHKLRKSMGLPYLEYFVNPPEADDRYASEDNFFGARRPEELLEERCQ